MEDIIISSQIECVYCGSHNWVVRFCPDNLLCHHFLCASCDRRDARETDVVAKLLNVVPCHEAVVMFFDDGGCMRHFEWERNGS